MGNFWLLSNFLFRFILIIFFIYYLFCFFGCLFVFDVDSGFIFGIFFYLFVFCRGIYIGVFRGLILCSCFG